MNGSVQSVAFNADGSRMFTAGGMSIYRRPQAFSTTQLIVHSGGMLIGLFNYFVYCVLYSTCT